MFFENEFNYSIFLKGKKNSRRKFLKRWYLEKISFKQDNENIRFLPIDSNFCDKIVKGLK